MIRLSKQTFMMLLGMAITSTCASAQSELPTEYEVKAAFIHNIAKFVEWPATRDATRTLKLCILGQNPYGSTLDALQGKPIGDKVWEVSSVNPKTNLRNCNVLFIAASESANLGQILNEIKDDAVLTVGDTEGFAGQGVMVNFYVEQGKVRFEINNDAAGRARLKISSNLLKLARLVQNTGGRK